MDQPIDLSAWERRCAAFLAEHTAHDAAHDTAHIARVVHTARQLAAQEGADLAVVLPAAWLHDCVIVPKHAPERARASQLAAEAAVAFLQTAGYRERYLPAIHHAIAAHSFSAQIAPRTVEARVVQDADRLDALGAIGLARCLMLGGAIGSTLYHPEEPFPIRRAPDDRTYSVDHFFVKLLTLAETMQTTAGRSEAARRTAFLHSFLAQLADELAIPPPGQTDSTQEPRLPQRKA